MENQMFCYQCQETAGCKGCTVVGVCGKKPEVDVLVLESVENSPMSLPCRIYWSMLQKEFLR